MTSPLRVGNLGTAVFSRVWCQKGRGAPNQGDGRVGCRREGLAQC